MAKLGGEIASRLADGRELRLRDAHARDARPLARLLDAVAAEPTVTLLMMPGQFDAGVWRRRISDAAADPRCLQLSAELDGELVGNLGLRPDPHPCSRHVTCVGMSVGESWRGLGVGGALLEASATWAGAHAVTQADARGLPREPARHRLLRTARVRARGAAPRAVRPRRALS